MKKYCVILTLVWFLGLLAVNYGHAADGSIPSPPAMPAGNNFQTACISVSDDLALDMCATYQNVRYGFVMNFYTNPSDSSGLYWKMDTSTFKQLSSDDSRTCVKVGSDLMVNICAEYQGTRYEFGMDLFPNSYDSAGLYWKMNMNTLKTSTAANPPSGGQGGQPPTGTPPDSTPPGSGTGSDNTTSGLASATGAYTLDGGTATQSSQTYTATNTDQSGIYVLNSGVLTLNNPTVITSGNTSSNDNSSFYGLNAGVLAASGSTVNIFGGTISTTGTGANGAFATGSGTSVSLSNLTITATGNGGHGVMATQGGTMTLTDVNITTSGSNSAPIATDRGSGTIDVIGGVSSSSGQDSPCLYSTGVLNVSDSTCTATGSESVVIEGSNSVTLTDVTLSSSLENKWGVMIYQSFSGDAEGSEGKFSMIGGSLANTAGSGPLFYITNATGIITLKGVTVTAASGTLLEAAANSRWGTAGSNGGTAIVTADGQALTGNMIAADIGSITASLKNSSSLTGAINADNKAKSVNLTLDSGSTWTVTADSYLTCLSDSGGISGTAITNIIGSGHTVYYKQSACSALGGNTYTLSGGGYLKPIAE